MVKGECKIVVLSSLKFKCLFNKIQNQNYKRGASLETFLLKHLITINSNWIIQSLQSSLIFILTIFSFIVKLNFQLSTQTFDIFCFYLLVAFFLALIQVFLLQESHIVNSRSTQNIKWYLFSEFLFLFLFYSVQIRDIKNITFSIISHSFLFESLIRFNKFSKMPS